MNDKCVHSPASLVMIADRYVDELGRVSSPERIREIHRFLEDATQRLGDETPVRRLMLLSARGVVAPRFEFLQDQACTSKRISIPTSLEQELRGSGWAICPWCDKVIIHKDENPVSASAAETRPGETKSRSSIWVWHPRPIEA